MRYFTLSILITFLFSCAEKGTKNFTSVKIETILTDSISVRAIAPQSEDQLWFAANAGRVGLIDKGVPKLATLRYGDSPLSFRSIALQKNALFVMSIGSPAVLYKIGIGGAGATTVEEVYTEVHEKVFYDAMAFWNENEGIAMGDPTEDCLSILITRDGGNTWHKTPCGKLPKTEAGEAAFAASNSNIAIVGDHAWLATGGKKARVFYSGDKGKTWEAHPTPIVQGQAMTGIYSIAFYDGENGVVFGGNWENKPFNKGNKARTADGGKTWELLSNGSGPGYRSCVQYVPNTGGKGIVAVGTPGISYSPDGGGTWQELSSEGFYTLRFVNDTLAFAGGANRIARLVFN
ncbi:MAG: WD40/YVTN/BNR-like repeat-containing protein [Marinirhabdus sp.]